MPLLGSLVVGFHQLHYTHAGAHARIMGLWFSGRAGLFPPGGLVLEARVRLLERREKGRMSVGDSAAGWAAALHARRESGE